MKVRTMRTEKKDIYIAVRDDGGKHYFCPLETVVNTDSVSEQELDECVGRDVVRRYAGNIRVNRQ